LAQFLRHRVSLIDNEVLVENLEHLSAYEVGHDVGMYVLLGLRTVCDSRKHQSKSSILRASNGPGQVAKRWMGCETRHSRWLEEGKNKKLFFIRASEWVSKQGSRAAGQ